MDEPVIDRKSLANGGPNQHDDDHLHHHRDIAYGDFGSIVVGSTAGARKHRKRRHKRAPGEKKLDVDVEMGDKPSAMAPSQRIAFLLDEGEDECGETHPIFTEMQELHGVGDSQQWREIARWVKFEEDVEEGGNRWSKPHVATLSLHSLFELRSVLMTGSIILDMEAKSFEEIVDITLEKMIATNYLEFMYKEEIRDTLLRRKTHQYEHMARKVDSQGNVQSSGSFISTVRSIADIGKTFSHGKNLHHHEFEAKDKDPGTMTKSGSGAHLGLPKVGSVPKDVSKTDDKARRANSVAVPPHMQIAEDKHGNKSQANSNQLLTLPEATMTRVKSSSVLLKEALLNSAIKEHGNLHFYKKLPSGSEACIVLVGEVEPLQHHIMSFARLKEAHVLEGITEVPVPTRFVFTLLGPLGHAQQYREMGRAIATLMTDEVFHDVCYRARERADLLDGIDEFLDQVTVLPPGEWDPNIRIEPPQSVPSQEKRREKKPSNIAKPVDPGDQGEPPPPYKEEEEDPHHDPTLTRTGRFCGGLIQDIKRKLPWYLSDYKDGLNMQCLATFCFMYFALLAPIVTFGGLLEEATGERLAAMENLVAAMICGVTYHLFAGQPLTVIGSTGPVLVFETIVFDLCKRISLNYLSLRFWINAWMCLFLLIIVVTDGSASVSYITRFTEESFATLIALIFIISAIQKLLKIMGEDQYSEYSDTFTNGSCTCIGSEKMPSFDNRTEVSDWFDKIAHKHHWNKRSFFANNKHWMVNANLTEGHYTIDGVEMDKVPLNYCPSLSGLLVGESCYHMYDVFLMSLVLMAGTFILAFAFKGMRNSRYGPSRLRQTLSDFAVMLAIVIMVGVDMLFGIATPKLNVPTNLRPTYHGRGWVVDPFSNPVWTILMAAGPAVVGTILIFMDQQITAVIVNRKENKLKKGGGYHLDLFVLSLQIFVVGLLGIPIYVAATVLSINHVNSLKMESESRAPGERPTFIGVRENRLTGVVTFLLLGLSVFLAPMLKLIPMPVLYGVFLYMGIAALNGIQLFDRLLLLVTPMKYQPDYVYLRHVEIKRVHMFTVVQILCLAMLWVIKSVKSTSILFPVMLVVMVIVRKLIEKIFTDYELKQLDDKMPEITLRKKEDKLQKKKKLKHVDTEPENLDGEDNKSDESGPGLHPVKTAGHIHIPMSTGNVMTVPLNAVREEDEPMNISDQLQKTSCWKHIESKASLQADKKDYEPQKSCNDDGDDGAITINITRASPSASASLVEKEPLLHDTKHGGVTNTSNNAEPKTGTAV